MILFIDIMYILGIYIHHLYIFRHLHLYLLHIYYIYWIYYHVLYVLYILYILYRVLDNRP